MTSLLPGTGGTGGPVYSQGYISGFGSVIVNGIKFDDSLASVKLDGLVAQSSDLQLGMVAGVQGERDRLDATLGTAQSIEVWSVAQGPVTSVSDSHFVVLGMTFVTDSNTTFEGADRAWALAAGQTILVWGLQIDTNATQWKATRVTQIPASNNRVVTGWVRQHDDELTLNGIRLSGEAAENLASDTVARVQGTWKNDGEIIVTRVELLNADLEIYANGVLEIEGVVTSLLPSSRLMLGNITVDASNPALSTVFGQLTVGDQIEVYGSWSSGVMVANQLILEGDGRKEIEIEARIDEFTSVSDFVMRGQRCNAASAEFSHGQASDLAVGKKVKVEGTMAGSVLMVRQLEFD